MSNDNNTINVTERLITELQRAVPESQVLIHKDEEAGDIPFLLTPVQVSATNLRGTIDALVNEIRNHERPEFLQFSKSFATWESFVAFFNRFANEESSLYVNMRNGHVQAVIDHQSSDVTSYERQKLAFTFPQSDEWKTWLEHDGKTMTQEDLAYFIEQNADDFVEPNGSDIYTMVTELKAKTTVDFMSNVSLGDGKMQFQYMEQVEGGGQRKGILNVPDTFYIGVPVLFNGDRYRVPVKLRYRVSSGKVVFWYNIVQRNAIWNKAMSEAVEKLTEAANSDYVYYV